MIEEADYGALKGWRVLIVEDDEELAARMRGLVEERTKVPPVVVHSMQEANEAMRGSRDESFGLVIMDVMLPETEKDFANIQSQMRIIDEARSTIRRLGPNPNDSTSQTALAKARHKRAAALSVIDELIVKDGGIRLVEKWFAKSANASLAVLYLTAVGNEAETRRGIDLAPHRSAWLTKPTSSEEILRKMTELLSLLGTASGG